jgi:hypothetical protein
MSPKAGENVTHNPILIYSPLPVRFSLSWSHHEEASQIENALGEKTELACAYKLSKLRDSQLLMVAPCSDMYLASICQKSTVEYVPTSLAYNSALRLSFDALLLALRWMLDDL